MGNGKALEEDIESLCWWSLCEKDWNSSCSERMENEFWCTLNIKYIEFTLREKFHPFSGTLPFQWANYIWETMFWASYVITTRYDWIFSLWSTMCKNTKYWILCNTVIRPCSWDDRNRTRCRLLANKPYFIDWGFNRRVL